MPPNMDPENSTGRCHCALCAAVFDSFEQLFRHLGTHGNRRPVICQFCERPFTRSDALTRHMKTCKIRLESGAPIPSISHRTRGKKRKACDWCMRLKRACNAGYPCNTCISKHRECVYTVSKEKRTALATQEYNRVPNQHEDDLDGFPCLDLGLTSPSIRLDGLHHSRLSPPGYEIIQDWPELTLSPTAISWSCELTSIPSQYKVGDCSKFEFLARYTGSTGLLNSFNCRVIRQRVPSSLLETEELQYPSNASSYSFDDVRFGLECSDNIEPTCLTSKLQMLYQKTNHLTVSPDGTIDSFHEWAIHRLAFKTHEIVTGLKETIRHKTRRSPVTLEWSPIVEQMCYHFFSPPNICRYIEAFWISWYPNCPILHKTSFNPTKASPLLLASMTIIGACVLPSMEDNQNAEIWFDAVEEMVFDDESLQEEYVDTHVNQSANGKSQKLEIIQAAYFVCLFQNWEGSETTQRRIRRRRYSTVVAVARDLDLRSAIHQTFWLINDASNFNWQAFIQKEETIRTLSYVFLLDSAFVIFHNTPPRIFGQELEMHINCPEAAFQAGSAVECFQHLKKWADEMLDHPSVSTAIETICQPDTELCLETYSRFGLLNMFVIISSLCVSIHQLQNVLAPSTAFVKIERGMKSWKNAWDKIHVLSNPEDGDVDDPLDEAWRRDGFMKCAWEYWLLGNVLLESIRSDSGDNSGVTKRALGKYDQTDMKQVRQLITQFNAMEM